VLVDVSGSMSPHTAGIASSLWVVSNAVSDIGGRTCGIAFGDAVELVSGPISPPRQVIEFVADGGTELADVAFALADETLSLSGGSGPRLVVVVSDGVWVIDGEERRAQARIAALRARGCGVIQVGIGSEPRPHGSDRSCAISDPDDLARIVGTAAVQALAEHSVTAAA
jgi:hypothetical protein